MRITGISKTKESKYEGVMGVFMGIGMAIMVLLIFVFDLNRVAVPIFLVIWFGGVAFSVYRSWRNATSDKGIPHEVSEIDLHSDDQQQVPIKCDFADRLRKLEDLRHDNIVTEEEYQAKRADILDGDWGS